MLTEFNTNFKAMGTNVSVIVVAERYDERVVESLRRVEDLFRSEESRFSRFLPDSELSLMNSQGGSESPSRELWDVLERAERWWKQTGGVFDPTILSALEAAGYDRSFDQIRFSALSRRRIRTVSTELGFHNVVLSRSGCQKKVILENDVRLDLGGIVKGWTVDRVGDMLIDSFDNFLIDAGGDILARGHSVSGEGWWVAVEDVFDATINRGCVLLKNAALATSGTNRRRWIDGNGRRKHHIIDPETGLSSDSGVVSVTTCGPTVEQCEVIAKSMIIDAERQLEWVQQSGDTEVSIVHADGSEYSTFGWEMIPIYPVDESARLEVPV